MGRYLDIIKRHMAAHDAGDDLNSLPSLPSHSNQTPETGGKQGSPDLNSHNSLISRPPISTLIPNPSPVAPFSFPGSYNSVSYHIDNQGYFHLQVRSESANYIDAEARIKRIKRNKGLSHCNRLTLISHTAAKKARNKGSGGEAEKWLALFEERAAFREFDAGYTRAEAEALAWGEMECRWHAEHGERVPRDICAGCRRPIGNDLALDMVDGNRVHDRADNQCLMRHGERWRRNATLALAALGLMQRDGNAND